MGFSTSEEDSARQFPDVQVKLHKPTKQSAFEKQRAEAEAKRQREAAETAAVYQDFVRSFEHDGTASSNTQSSFSRSNFPPSRPRVSATGPAMRRFGTGSSTNTFRDGAQRSSIRSKEPSSGHRAISKAFMGSDDEDEDSPYQASDNFADRGRDSTSTSARAQEKAIAKPTLRLSNLPPGTSVSRIKSLVSPFLTVDGVNISASQLAAATERRSAVAIVTLSQDTPATEIDQTVSALQHRYLGYGYYLSLHRHLSSAVSVMSSGPTLGSSTASSAPFGAKPAVPVPQQQHRHNRRFAPPSMIHNPLSGRNRILHVPVQPPNDINQIRLIHSVVEALLEHGPEFEALLMSRSEVQQDEKWAWLWDARSEGGIWYRWRIWEVVTGFTSSSRAHHVPIFEDSHAWKAPEKKLLFEHTTRVEEFCSDPDYDSDEEAEVDEDGPFRGGERQSIKTEAELSFLNPLNRTRLAHLLSRLPVAIHKLRKGDVARITAFAIKNASHGAEEIVDMVVWNVEHPFALTATQVLGDKDGTIDETEPLSNTDKPKGDDLGAACLVSLYVVNDILSSSSTSGIRHAWKYRQLFENVLKRRKVFETLGAMPEKFGWGRLRMEKWRRSISLVLSLWEGWCVFQTESHEHFSLVFENPPPSARAMDSVGQREDSQARPSTEKASREVTDAQKWKVVETTGSGISGEFAPAPSQKDGNSSSLDRDFLEAKPAHKDDAEDDVDGMPMSDEEIDGEVMSDTNIDGEPMSEEENTDTVAPLAQHTSAEPDDKGPGEESRRSRKRIRAVDMFADSDASGS